MCPERSKTTRILIVDRHPIVHFGLSQLINQEPDMCVSGTVSGMTEALQIVESGEVDLIVAGVSLKDGSGMDLIKHVKAKFDKLPVLVFSMLDEPLFAERMLHAGALGYVTKNEPVGKILAAIRRVLEGDVYVSEPIVRQLLRYQGPAPADCRHTFFRTLTDRELEVYNLIGSGKSNREIATFLHINVKTVETHCAHIIKKLKLEGMSGLTRDASSWFRHMGEAGPTPLSLHEKR